LGGKFLIPLVALVDKHSVENLNGERHRRRAKIDHHEAPQLPLLLDQRAAGQPHHVEFAHDEVPDDDEEEGDGPLRAGWGSDKVDIRGQLIHTVVSKHYFPTCFSKIVTNRRHARREL
jgi:hypothetical protein